MCVTYHRQETVTLALSAAILSLVSLVERERHSVVPLSEGEVESFL